LELTAAISAVVVIAMAIAAAVLLRRVRAGPEEHPDLEPDGVAVGSIGVEEALGPAGECGNCRRVLRTPGTRASRGGR
jgi:hypothetical protein